MAMIVRALLALLIFSGPVFAGSQQTSSTTAATIITYARYYLNEASEDFWDDDALLRFLNDGMVDISARTHCYQGTESVSLVASTVEYSLSTNYNRVLAAVYNPASGASKGLVKGNIRSVGSASGGYGTQQPAYWYEFAGKIGIYPSLSSVTTETVTVYLSKRPTAIASGTNVTTPAVFDKALVYYIVAQAYLQDQQPGEAYNYLNLYQQELDRYRQDFVEADGDTIEEIK